MFAIAGIVLVLAHVELRAPALAALVPLPLGPLLVALVFFGLAVDVKLRKSELAATPLLGWALVLVAWSAIRFALSPSPTWHAAVDGALPIVLYLAIAQGVQRFSAIGVVAATLVLVALAAAALRFADDPVGHTAALAVAAPLGFAYVARNRSAPALLAWLALLAVVAGCVILTRSRAPHFTYDLRNGWDWPTLLLGAIMLAVALRITRAVRREYAGDPDAAVARAWARALQLSLVVLVAAFVFAPAVAGRLFWSYAGLAGALYQATRAHDPKFALRAYNPPKG